jgi:multiple antibiotic resistance protein
MHGKVLRTYREFTVLSSGRPTLHPKRWPRLETRGRDRVENLLFVFTVAFMLLGPLKLIPGFVQLTRDTDRSFKRKLAIRGSVIACATIAFAGLAGQTVEARFGISLDAVRLGGGLVLLISALHILFPTSQPPHVDSAKSTVLQLAISPLAMPMIVPPAGIAAILIFVMLAPQYPGIEFAAALAVASIIGLDFLIMFFIDYVVKIPGLLLFLQVCGAVLVFVQVALAIETIIVGFTGVLASH